MRTPKIGEKVWIKGDEKYSPPNGKQCTITKWGLGIVWVHPKYSHDEDIEVDEENIIYIEPETLSFEEKTDLIRKFVKSEYIDSREKLIMELRHLNNLIKKYPKLEFWRTLNIDYQMKSLSWWHGGGKTNFRKLYNEKTLDLSSGSSKIDSTLTTNVVVTDTLDTKHKPKSILDI